MNKIKEINYFLWVKRMICYLAGLFIMGLGTVFSVNASLGVGPVTSVGNAMFEICYNGMKIEFMTLGTCTAICYICFILLELVLLGKEFKLTMCLQVFSATIFGVMVDLAVLVLSFVPMPDSYILRLIYLICSLPIASFGVTLYLAAGILPLPSDGVPLAISKRTGKAMTNCKIFFDCAMVAMSALATLIYFGTVIGVREGTVIAALLMGTLMKFHLRWAGKAIYKFVDRPMNR